MATAKQIDANGRNAEKSTGPKTPQGKQTASQNAVRHGLTAASPIILPEEEGEFAQFVQAMRENHQPQGALEHLLVDRMTSCAWRLRRVPHIETSVLLREPGNNGNSDAGEENVDLAGKKKNDGPGALGKAYTRNAAALARLSRHERQLDRSFYQALEKLGMVQYARVLDCSVFYAANLRKFSPPDSDRAKKNEEGHYRSGAPAPVVFHDEYPTRMR